MGTQTHPRGLRWPLGSLSRERPRAEEEEAVDSCVWGLGGLQAPGWPPAGEVAVLGGEYEVPPCGGPTPAESSLLTPKSN